MLKNFVIAGLVILVVLLINANMNLKDSFYSAINITERNHERYKKEYSKLKKRYMLMENRWSRMKAAAVMLSESKNKNDRAVAIRAIANDK